MAENWEDQAVPVQPVADWEAKAVPVQAPAPRPPAPKGEGTISAISPEEYQKVEAQSERAGTPLERAQGQGGTLKTLPRRIQEATAYGAGASLAAVAGLPAGVLHYSALPAYALGLTKTGDAINRVADAITPSSAQADLAKQAPKTAEGKIVAAGAKFATDVVTLGAGGKVLANTGKIPKWAIPSYFAVQTAGNSASMAHASGKDASQPIRTTVGATSEAALAYLAGMTIGRTVPGPEFSNPMATAGAQIAGAGGVGAALQTGQNLVAKGTYDPDRPLMSGVWESAAMFGAASLANTLNQTGTQRAAMLEHPQGPEAYMKDFKTAVDNAEVAHDEGHLKTNVYQGMKRAYDRSQAVFKQLMKTTAGKEAQAKAAAAEEFPTVKQLFPEGKGPTPEQEVKDALQKQGPAEAVSREGSEGGNLPEGREGVGQGQQGEETPREEEVQKEVAKPKAPVKIVDQTSYKGVRQGSLMGPDDEMMVAKDAKGNDIGKLWVTKKPDGFEVRKVEVDPKSRRQGVAEQLYVEAHSRYGAYQGATDQTPDGKAMNARLRETHPEIFEDAQKTKKSPVEPLGEPKPVPIVFKKGMNLANIEKTLATLPEVKEGYTRLFRGSSPTGKFEDTFDSSKLKDVAPTREGEHYTDDFSMADYFRASYGKDASISYLDVPSGQAEQAKTRDREYILPSDKGPVDLSSLAKKGDAYMVPPRSIDPTPDNAVPKSLQSVPGLKVSGDVFEIPTDSLSAAPERFQFRSQNEATGVRQVNSKTGASGSLHGVSKWNTKSAGIMDVWRDPEDGKVYVVNGHNRYDKALELGINNLKVRFLDAKDATEAMTQGALMNIAEGHATPLDVAVYLKKSGTKPSELEEHGIPLKKKPIQDGIALASLPDDWVQAASDDPGVMRLAIEAGKASLDKKQAGIAFKELHDLIAKRGSADDIPMPLWKEMVDRIKATQGVKGAVNLFGDEEMESTLPEQADIIRHIQGKLGAEKTAGQVLTGKRYSEAVGKAAEVNQGEAGAMKAEATTALGYFNQEKSLTGIGDIINDYAAKLHQAGSAKESAAIREQAVGAVREEIRQAHAGGDNGRGTEPRAKAEALPGKSEGGLGLEEQPKDIPKVPEKPAKAAPKVDQESTSRRKDLVKAIEPDPMVRAKMYRISGILNGDVDPTEEQIKAAQRQVRRSIKGVPAPLQGIIDRDPERGAIRVSLPRGVSLGPVFERLGRYFGKQGLQRQGPIQKGNAVVALARALDAKGMLQHPYDRVTRVMPEIAKSMVTGDVPAPLKTDSGANRDIPDMDTKTNQVIHGLRSPHKIIESMFPPGEGPNIDQEFVSNRYIVLQKALTDYVNGVHKRYQIPDHSARIGAVMDPYRTKIRDIEQWLVPLLNTRKEMETMLDQAERPEELVKRLAEFDEENAERIGEGRRALQNLYREAKLKIYDLAQTTPEVRVAMYMEPPKKRPAWLAEIIKPNEVEAAKAFLRFTSEARVAGSWLGIPMMQDEYIIHLFAPQGISRFTRDMTGEQDRVARDILAFHHRQPDSVNLMPSTHAAMAYYVPTISRKIATQPFLNKWYADGKNVYLDQNDQSHYAPNFGKWLQQRITEIEHPPQETVWEKGLQAIKSAEITKDMAFNQRVTIKHLVGKITGLVALHHAYLLPASKDFMLRLARKPENLPLVRNAYERITGKPFEGNKDAKLVQALTTNLISSRQIRNALMEDPLVAEYNQPILNSFFGRSVRGAVQPVLNAAQKTRNILGQPLTAVEAFENELNFLASVHQGQQARLTPEEDVRGAVLNLLDYSFRGGHDASAFLKSPMGRMTAFSQTPTKMLENYVDIIRKGFNGEPDIYGSAGGATLVRAIVAAGAVSWLGEKYGKKAGLKLWRMLLHVPVVNEDYASDALSYAYHTLMADASNDPKHKRAALLAHRRMQGNQQGAMSLSPAGDILEDLTRLTNNPKAFVKSFPAVKQIESEVGKVPKGYEDTLHYLSNAPTPEAEKKWEHMREQKGKSMMRKDEKRSRQ